MCCAYDAGMTQEMAKKLEDEGPQTFYKFYCVRRGVGRYLVSPYQFQRLEIVNGFIESNRIPVVGASLTEEERQYGDISYGIHVFLTEDRARQGMSSDYVLLPVKGHYSDLVGVGSDGTAVFTRVAVDEAGVKQIIDNFEPSVYHDEDEDDDEDDDEDEDEDYCDYCGSHYCSGECEDEDEDEDDDDLDDDEDEEDDED